MNGRKTKTLMIIALSTTFAFASAAQAYEPDYDYARVTRVTPIVETYEVATPHEECWSQPVEHRVERPSPAGAIIGGIIGGVVGSRFGRGDGRKAAIIGGTIAGAGIGQTLGRHGNDTYTSYEDRCRTETEYRTEQRTVGYRVHYRYHGRNYTTRMDHAPGARIRVRVSVEPVSH